MKVCASFALSKKPGRENLHFSKEVLNESYIKDGASL